MSEMLTEPAYNPYPYYVLVFSGGLDSTTLLYEALIGQNARVDLVSFNYGQRHKKELAYAKRTAHELGLRHDVIDLSGITELLAEGGSSLLDNDVEVPEGHYAEDNMVKTIVPNRNMMMISIAGALAVARGAHYVITGVHAGDHFIYPDCRPAFIKAASAALNLGNLKLDGKQSVEGVLAPYATLSKGEIAAKAFSLEVPIANTWSCYKGGEKHCGRCGTCVERAEALAEGIRIQKNLGNPDTYEDPTQYEDSEYWKQVVQESTKA